MAPHLSIIVKPRDEIGPNIAPDTDIGIGLCSPSFGLFKHMLSRVLRSRPKVGDRLLIRWTLWLMGIAAIIGSTTMPLAITLGHAHWDQVSWVPFDDHRLNFPIFSAMWLSSSRSDTFFRRLTRPVSQTYLGIADSRSSDALHRG
jgi:hypothetical protein